MVRQSLALGLLLTIGLYDPANAGVLASVHTSIDGAAGYFDHFAMSPDDPALTAAHAWGHTIDRGGQPADGGANAGAGTLPCGGFQTPCFTTGSPSGVAAGLAQANGANGSLRAWASASADPGSPIRSASANAGLWDTVTFQGAPVIDIDLDLTPFISGDNANYGLVFTLDICGVSGCASSSLDILDLTLLVINAPTGNDRVHTTRWYDENGVPVQTQDSVIPHNVNLSLDLGFLGGTTFEIIANLGVFANAEDGGATIAADQTLYLEMANYISQSGYTYAGRQVVDPPPTGIPAPPSLALLASGLAILAWRRRRRSQAAQ